MSAEPTKARTPTTGAAVIECVTVAERNIAAPAYLAVCTGEGDLIAVSRRCPGEDEGECGGHPICRPCYELGVVKGLIAPRDDIQP